MKKRLSIGQLFAILIPAMIAVAVISAQFCYRFLLMPAEEKHNKEMVALTEKYNPKEDNFAGKFREMYETICKNYIYEWDKEQFQTTLLKVMASLLKDPYGSYYTKEEYQQLLSSFNGSTVGIGIQIRETETNQLMISYVEEDSPANKAGVLPDDEIIAVEGKAVSEIGTEKAIELLQGGEGTTASFTVDRKGATVQFSIKREKLKTASVKYSMEEGKIGYIRITGFQNNTYKEFKSAVDGLIKEGAVALVFDLRNNSGGLLDSVIDVLDYILPDKTGENSSLIVTTVDGQKSEKRYYCADKHEIDLPMAVLINGNTASAAELFTAALRDYKLAFSVGEKSFGKGVAQGTYTFSDGDALKITTLYYNPPCGENYDGTGITPDIEVIGNASDCYLLPHEEDPVYIAAVAQLNSEKN